MDNFESHIRPNNTEAHQEAIDENNVRATLNILAEEVLEAENIIPVPYQENKIEVEIEKSKYEIDKEFNISIINFPERKKLTLTLKDPNALIGLRDEIDKTIDETGRNNKTDEKLIGIFKQAILSSRVGKPMIAADRIDFRTEQIVERTQKIREMSKNQQEYPECFNNWIDLTSGNMIHGTRIENVENIINHGLLCGEVINGQIDNFQNKSIGQVETSFFADVWEFPAGRDHYYFQTEWIAQPNNDNISICFSSAGKSFSEKDIARPHDFREKGFGELLHNFPEPEMDHVGIFVGVASSDIIGLKIGGFVDVEKLKHILIKNKKFYPIYSADNALIFSEEEYLKEISDKN